MANNDQNNRDLDQITEDQIITGLSLQGADESALEDAEPWESWETKLVLWSILIGISGLVVLGTLINIFLLK